MSELSQNSPNKKANKLDVGSKAASANLHSLIKGFFIGASIGVWCDDISATGILSEDCQYSTIERLLISMGGTSVWNIYSTLKSKVKNDETYMRKGLYSSPGFFAGFYLGFGFGNYLTRNRYLY